MEKFAFNRSMKDIPIPSEDQYRKQLLYQTERFIQRIRWIAYFFLNPDNTPADKETFEFKTTKTAPQVQELIIFEQQLADLVSTGIKFRKWRNPYQRELDKAVKEIKKLDSVQRPTCNLDDRLHCEKINLGGVLQFPPRSRMNRINATFGGGET